MLDILQIQDDDDDDQDSSIIFKTKNFLNEKERESDVGAFAKGCIFLFLSYLFTFEGILIH